MWVKRVTHITKKEDQYSGFLCIPGLATKLLKIVMEEEEGTTFKMAMIITLLWIFLQSFTISTSLDVPSLESFKKIWVYVDVIAREM